MRPTLAVGVAALLVLAGCAGAPSAGETGTATDGAATTDAGPTSGGGSSEDTTAGGETTTPTRQAPDLGIEVQNGDLPYDPNLTWARVQGLLGTNVSPPSAVLVVDPDAAGSTSGGGNVYINSKDEAVLAHEFVHSILLRAHDVPPSGSPDERFAHAATIEGAAQYVDGVYERRYLDRAPRSVDRLPEDPYRAYFVARYYYGARYFEARVDDTAAVPRLHRNPPNTSEQVLHGLAPGSEPPTTFAVTVPTRHLRRDATWEYGGRRRLGEVGLRATLWTRLGDDRAARGADGWGNDQVVAFERDGTTGFAWVVHWDDPANATEFERALRRFRNASPPQGPPGEDGASPYPAFTERTWFAPSPTIELRRVDDRTTAVLFGSETFVDAVSLSVNGSVYTVAVGNGTDTTG